MPKLLGKREAVDDKRMAALHDVIDRSKIPPPPKQVNWRAHMPASGIPMLGNDKAGNCVFASILHYLQLASLYTLQDKPLEPTEAEAIAAYSAVTGYDPANSLTDGGTYVMGPLGAMQYWTTHGITCGGVLNHLTSAATVDFRDQDHLKQALSLGPVFCGVQLTESDLESQFLWNKRAGQHLGGHEVLLVGYDQLSSGYTWFDIETWDGLWRATGDWMREACDETVMVFNDAFFGRTGLDPAGIDRVAIADRMAQLHA